MVDVKEEVEFKKKKFQRSRRRLSGSSEIVKMNNELVEIKKIVEVKEKVVEMEEVMKVE